MDALRRLKGPVVRFALAFSILATGASNAFAQFGGAGGVSVDADGVLKIRKVGGAKLKAAREDRHSAQPGRVYISLPKLFKEVERCLAENRKLPDNVRFLEGMVKLENIFVYPEEKDLVIAGRCEPFDVSDAYRPVGNITGRPVLQLDDLVVALRAVGPGGQDQVFGCSIDLPEGGIQRMQAVSAQIGAVRQGNYAGPGRKMAAAVGPQNVRIFGIPASTRFALVCLEADYLMKRLALGLDKSPVPGVKSYLALMKQNEGVYNRQWFNPMYEPLLVAIDGLGYELRGQGLKVSVSASDSSDDQNSATPSAKRFAELMTEHFVELARLTPSYADLWNLIDLGVAAAVIRTDKLNDRAGWKCDWILDQAKYKVASYPVPKTAETLVNYRKVGGPLVFAIGGVQVSADDIVESKHRSQDVSGRITQLGKKRVTQGWSKRIEKSESGAE